MPTDHYEAHIAKTLEKLDGELLFAYSLWRQPDGVEWSDSLPKNWPHEYVQSAGDADGMSIEIRRLDHDEYRQYTIADVSRLLPDRKHPRRLLAAPAC